LQCSAYKENACEVFLLQKPPALVQAHGRGRRFTPWEFDTLPQSSGIFILLAFRE
jgi:hypothetical protein